MLKIINIDARGLRETERAPKQVYFASQQQLNRLESKG
jgi:hypothetical protein